MNINIKNQNSTRSIKKHQKGVSLIELMIAMVVGLFLLAGVVTNFISTTNADVKRDAVSEMDANAQLIFGVLRHSISHAGYASIENARIEKGFFTDSDGNPDQNVTCRNGIKRDVFTPQRNRRTRDISTRDMLTVVSLADNPCRAGLTSCPDPDDVNPNANFYTDCTGGGADRNARTVSCSTDETVGMENPEEAIIYSTFRLIKNTSSVNNRVFLCDGSRGLTQPISTDVEAIQYLYGVRDSSDQISYRTANQIENADQWGMVVSVQVGILLRSSNLNVLDSPSHKKEYNLLKTNVKIADDDLRRLFRIYTTTINLENADKGALL